MSKNIKNISAFELMNLIIDTPLPNTKPQHKSLLLTLARHTNAKRDNLYKANPSLNLLSRRLGCSTDTITSITTHLVKCGYISVEKTKKNHSFINNTYYINVELIKILNSEQNN